MDTRKKLLSAAVAGLFAMGIAAQPLVATANEGEEGGEKAAEKNHCKGKGNHCAGAAKKGHGKGHGKDSCKGGDGCGAKKKGAEEHHEE
jgi:hypothetical protein